MANQSPASGADKFKYVGGISDSKLIEVNFKLSKYMSDGKVELSGSTIGKLPWRRWLQTKNLI